MSYSFTVRKNESGTLEFVYPESLESTARHIPDGAVFAINGHHPSEDSSTVGTLGITLNAIDGVTRHYVGSATGSYNTSAISKTKE